MVRRASIASTTPLNSVGHREGDRERFANEIESGRVELQSYSDESSLGWEIESKKSQSYSVEVQLQFLQVKLNPSLADAWLCLGNCIWKKGDLPSAKNCFTLALSKIDVVL
ncbi:hypothetical protein CsSME_00003933 [Camellia sinensis var. sinensis]